MVRCVKKSKFALCSLVKKDCCLGILLSLSRIATRMGWCGWPLMPCEPRHGVIPSPPFSTQPCQMGCDPSLFGPGDCPRVRPDAGSFLFPVLFVHVYQFHSNCWAYGYEHVVEYVFMRFWPGNSGVKNALLYVTYYVGIDGNIVGGCLITANRVRLISAGRTKPSKNIHKCLDWTSVVSYAVPFHLWIFKGF